MLKTIRIHPLLVIIPSGIMLMQSLIHGPGRGFSLVPVNDHGYQFIRLLAYGAFLAGSILSAKFPRIAAFILFVGILARAELELRCSLGKTWFVDDGWTSLAYFLFVVAFYMLTFILPALFAIDCVRSWRSEDGNTKAREATRKNSAS